MSRASLPAGLSAARRPTPPVRGINERAAANAAVQQASNADPITPAQRAVIAGASRQLRRVRRAATVAALSGWTTATFGVLTLLCGLFSPAAFLLGLGMCIAAWIELRSGAALRRFDPAAAVRLGFNQIALATIVIIYAAWSLVQTVVGPNPYQQYIDDGGELARLVEPIARLHTSLSIGIYAAIIVVSFIAQGSLSAYYFTRRRHVLALVSHTPRWVIETLRAVC